MHRTFKRAICDHCDSHWMCVVIPQENGVEHQDVMLCGGCLKNLSDEVREHEGDDNDQRPNVSTVVVPLTLIDSIVAKRATVQDEWNKSALWLESRGEHERARLYRSGEDMASSAVGIEHGTGAEHECTEAYVALGEFVFKQIWSKS